VIPDVDVDVVDAPATPGDASVSAASVKAAATATPGILVKRNRRWPPFCVDRVIGPAPPG
jgi:hypothetical protein